MRVWRGIVGGLLAALLATGCGLVPDAEERARDLATDRVRGRATRLGTELWAVLRATDVAGAREVVRKHTEMLSPAPDPASPSQQSLLAASVGSDGAVVLDLVFRDEAYTGGGLSYAQAVVQLCVRVTGTPGPAGQVRLADLACPASLAGPGLVDHQVTLAEEGPPPAPERRYSPCLSGGGNEECAGG